MSEVFTVITETREAADQFAREGEAACIQREDSICYFKSKGMTLFCQKRASLSVNVCVSDANATSPPSVDDTETWPVSAP